MKRYIITGAAGHLAGTIIRMLKGTDAEIYGLIMPNEEIPEWDYARYIKGDVRDIDSMRPLFTCEEDTEMYVIHAAGIIDIAEKASPLITEVNINGTKNVIKLCQEYNVKRLLYISTVHTIPEPESNKERVTLREVNEFDPDKVVGAYAVTKAAATQAVLDAGKEGLDVIVVHPSAIVGPYDKGGNHIVQLINDYIEGNFPVCVHGGYDFVDVRDVARGILLALEKGKRDNCYIFSGHRREVLDILTLVREDVDLKPPVVLPMWLAKAGVPFIKLAAKCRNQRPLYTRYSLDILMSNIEFSHDKATKELGYTSRELKETVHDTVEWYFTTHKDK